MKMTIKMYKFALFTGALAVAAGFTGCNNDDEEDTPPVNLNPPVISIEGDEEATLAPGETTDVVLNFNGDGGAAAIIVNRDGGFLEQIPISAGATTYTYTTPAVPDDASEGQIINYSFALQNTQGAVSGETPFNINVAIYPTITIGGTELYNVTLPVDGIVPSGTVVTLAQDRSYYIESTVIFDVGSEFNVGEGTIIYLNADAADPVEVVINGTTNIEGTSGNPVVMTSSNTLSGSPAPGDWLWFRLNGTGNGSSNGSISYLRIEYGGDRAFRLVNVGNGTNIDHVQVFKAAGEGIMITDGDVNLKNLVATDCEGGSYRLGDAYSGNMQFVLSVNSTQFSDNDDFTVRESASPTIANLTLLGPGTSVDDTHGLRLRAASSGKVYNAAITDFPRRGVRGVDEIVITDLNGPTVFAYSYVWNVPTDPYRDLATAFAGEFDANGTQTANPFFNNATGIDSEGNYMLDAIAGIGNGSFVPTSTQQSAFNPSSLGGFFASAPFVGAVENSSGDWTIGWVLNPDGSLR